ncbi:uncharacterized protein DS421_15g499990 [Arachis hypogaea]|nr:uncharacterized protein DS421_15g499990 [Arachis hypogaea]
MSSIHAENAVKGELVRPPSEGGVSLGGCWRRPVMSCWHCEFATRMGYLENSGLYFGFTVVLPGDPFKVELDATGHFRLNEKVTQEDAALEMLGCVLEIIVNFSRVYLECFANVVMARLYPGGRYV